MPPTKKNTILALLGACAMLAGSSVQAQQSGWSNSSESDGGGWNDNSNGGNGGNGGDAAQDDNGGQQQDAGGDTGTGEIDCSFQGDPAKVTDAISFRHILNQIDNTLTVELTYQGTGWVALGVSADGQMPGAEVVIAMPDAAPSGSNPGKYSIGGRTQDAIVLSGQQTLVDASFEQDGVTTVLRFTKALAETGELEISADGSNTFVYAVGNSNTFGYHKTRGSFSVAALTQCVLAGQTAAPTTEGGGGEIITGGGGSDASAVPSKSLWVAHGILMFISWGILLPIGIGASLIRRLVPGSGTWFVVHRAANGLAFLLTTAAFGIAVYNVKVDHFSAQSRHKVIGLVIYVFMFLQVLGGIFRPHLPHAAPPKVVVEDDVEADDAGPKPAAASPQQEQEEAPKKSTKRVAFEVGHRIFGYGLLGLSWYQLYLGVMLMAGFYGPEYDLSAAMWGVIGGISGLVFVLFVYTKAVPERKKD